MLTDDEVRKVRDGVMLGYNPVREIADELLKRRHPWRPISELPPVKERDDRLMLVRLEGEKSPLFVRWYKGYWRGTKGSFESGDFACFMEIPELEESDA